MQLTAKLMVVGVKDRLPSHLHVGMANGDVIAGCSWNIGLLRYIRFVQTFRGLDDLV